MSQRPSLAQHMGELVWDGESRRVGVLMDVRAEVGAEVGDSRLGDPPPSDVPLLAFLRPQHGGREWTVPLESVSALERSARAEEEQPAGCSDGSRSSGTCLPLAEDDGNGGTVTETAEAAEIVEITEAIEAIEATEATESAEAAGVAESAESAEATEVANSDAAEVSDSEEGSENRGGAR